MAAKVQKIIHICKQKSKKQKTLLYISNQKKPKNKFAPFKILLYLCRRFAKKEHTTPYIYEQKFNDS